MELKIKKYLMTERERGRKERKEKVGKRILKIDSHRERNNEFCSN